jgi:hypothetical protein
MRPAGRGLDHTGLDNVGCLTSHNPIGLHGLLYVRARGSQTQARRMWQVTAR